MTNRQFTWCALAFQIAGLLFCAWCVYYDLSNDRTWQVAVDLCCVALWVWWAGRSLQDLRERS
jgi:hypothetical protein